MHCNKDFTAWLFRNENESVQGPRPSEECRPQKHSYEAVVTAHLDSSSNYMLILGGLSKKDTDRCEIMVKAPSPGNDWNLTDADVFAVGILAGKTMYSTSIYRDSCF